jgi:hypothetical protein
VSSCGDSQFGVADHGDKEFGDTGRANVAECGKLIALDAIE